MIKGGPEDDAVLCTSDKTYNIRSVTLSNSVLLVSPSPRLDGSEENQVVIQDSLNELLELVPAVPKLHRMNVLLKEHVWEEGHDEDEEDEESFRAVSTGDKSYTIPPNGEAHREIYFPRQSGNGLLLKMLG
jgi:sister chromatid cohesion protein DCC1